MIELLAEVALYLKWLIITVLKGLLYGPNCSYSLNIVLTDFEEIVFIYPVDFGEVSALGWKLSGFPVEKAELSKVRIFFKINNKCMGLLVEHGHFSLDDVVNVVSSIFFHEHKVISNECYFVEIPGQLTQEVHTKALYEINFPQNLRL